MRIRIVMLVVLALTASQRAQAQACRADFDGSGAVEVGEVILVVNEALGGCGGAAATPTRRTTPTRTPTRTPTVAAGSCPYRFNQAVDADRFCGYAGPVNSTCGPFPVVSGWLTSGTDVIGLLTDDTGSIGVFGRRTSPTAAAIDGVAFGPDFETLYDASGTMSLPSNAAFAVTVAFGSDCGTLRHSGTFVEILGGAGARAAGAGIAPLRAAMQGRGGTAVAALGGGGGARLRALVRALRR